MEMCAEALAELLEAARQQGASDARWIAASRLRVDAHLAALCRQCPHYSLSASCPPHALSPQAFLESLAQYRHALVFKFDLPGAALLSEKKDAFARRVHEIAAFLERLALGSGFALAWGLAAGSCKPLFCPADAQCRAIQPGGACRFPDQARPSISAMGIDFFDLCNQLGWEISRITRAADPADAPNGMLAGLVLLG